jgi:hypothetical protein
MTAITVHIAESGGDHTVVAARYDFWFARLVHKPGKETREGADCRPDGGWGARQQLPRRHRCRWQLDDLSARRKDLTREHFEPQLARIGASAEQIEHQNLEDLNQVS